MPKHNILKIIGDSQQWARENSIPTNSITTPNTTYQIPNITGGEGPIYNFFAPPEQLTGQLAISDDEKRELLIFYFQHLYPMTPREKWGTFTIQQLEDYYYKLDFWYTFNPSWTVSPTPVTLDPRVIQKWEKNTFYQAGTIVQSSITSLSWDYDNSGKKYYYASRLNNASQVDPAYSYKNQTLRNVCRNKDFWEDMLGKKIEITSWGWSPYPFGIYAQGPFRGTGNFMKLPDRAMIGTSHWDIIYQCKNDNVSDEEIWSNIFNHELSRIQTSVIFMEDTTGNRVYCTPWVIKKKNNSYYWDTLLPNYSGLTPIITSYHCFIMGGFGGIGDKWIGNTGPFWNSWNNGTTDNDWGPGYYYAPLIEETIDSKGNTVLTCPMDQSIPSSIQLQGFPSGRQTVDMWRCFGHMFKDFICRWDSNYAVEMWRYPIFGSGNGDFLNTSPCVYNACDDFMMAMATGNFDIVHYSPWGASMLNPKLSKFWNAPMGWEKTLNPDGSLSSGRQGFPTGKLNRLGSGYTFIVRSQMPNVNGDICLELADFRMLTPGLLSNGAGDQGLWAQMFGDYCADYMFTVDPFNQYKYHSFSGDYAPWLPDTTLQKVSVDNTWWKHNENPLTGRSFFNFDVYSGQWSGWLTYTGKRNGAVVAFDSHPAKADSAGLITLSDQVYNQQDQIIKISTDCIQYPLKNVVPNPVEPYGILGNSLGCYKNKIYYCVDIGCRNFTFAYDGDYVYPFAPDSFSSGVVGFQANGWYANIGACQTRWWICSKGISWNFNAPLANRLIAKNGLRLKNHKLGAHSVPEYVKWILIALIMIVSGIGIYIVLKKPVNYKIILVACMVMILVTILLLFYIPTKKHGEKENKLRVYFSLIYPMVNPNRWVNMSYNSLVKFYCSLHQWYRGDGLPSPIEYLKSTHWQNQPPLNSKSSWKNFTTRKSCIIGTPRALNPYDKNVVIGYDGYVDTSITETPSGILFRRRQIQGCGDGANIQHVSFFSPSQNMWVDTFDASSSVNDPDLTQWQNAEYVEVSSQWGPFPDGAYFDWAQGTGVWLKLGKHVVGLNGQDLVRRLGEETMTNINTYRDGLKDVYFQLWQRTGLDGMTVNQNGDIINPGTCTTCGMYGTIIMTMEQLQQIQSVLQAGQWWAHSNDTFNTADGLLYQRLTNYIKPTYYDVEKQIWVEDIPTGQGHVENYPFPLPFWSKYVGDSQNKPIINDYAIMLPWKYQQFNVSSLYRTMTINAVFLNADVFSYADLLKRGADYNYVDLLKANKTSPLKSLKTWDDAINIINNLLQKPVVHPFFSIYPRIPGQQSDGPTMILQNDNEWLGRAPSVQRVQIGALDKNVYIQDTIQSGGVELNAPMNAPQLQGADLEIDHWTSALAQMLGYDAAARIQHWCGNKSLSYDLEVIHFRIVIPGNLITNKLDGNIYEIWKAAYQNGWFSLRDPFYPSNHVYKDVYKDVYNGKDISSNSKNATWVPPPWINYDPNNNLYGWEPEGLDTFANTQRLSYAPISAEEIGFSNSYPEYNSYIMNHFMKQLT